MKHLLTFSWLRGVEAAHLSATYQLNKSVSNTARPGYLDQGGVWILVKNNKPAVTQRESTEEMLIGPYFLIYIQYALQIGRLIVIVKK